MWRVSRTRTDIVSKDWFRYVVRRWRKVTGVYIKKDVFRCLRKWICRIRRRCGRHGFVARESYNFVGHMSAEVSCRSFQSYTG